MLNPKQERFAEEYLVDLNGMNAAIRAGYSPKTAKEQASKLLTDGSQVRARVDELIAERSKRTGITADRVIRELARIAFADPTKIIDADTGTLKQDDADDNAAISSIKVRTSKTKNGDDIVEREIRVWDKNKALELLGKHLGMYTDKTEVSGPNGAPINLEFKGVLDEWAK